MAQALVLKTESGAVNVITPQESPELFDKFRQWQAAPERSYAEKLAWDRLIEFASDYQDADIVDVESHG